MISIPNINPRYRGNDMVAIVKVGNEYIPRGTFEYVSNRDVTLFSGCDLPAAKVSSVTIPKNTLGGMLAARLSFLQRLDEYEQEGKLYALFLGVCEASAEPIAQAIQQLNTGKDVDLESLLS